MAIRWFALSLGLAAASGADECVWTWVAGPNKGVPGPNSSNVTADGMVTPRCCMGQWKHRKSLYLFGGGDWTSFYADIWKFDTSASNPVWTPVSGPSNPTRNFGGNQTFPAARNYPITWTRETKDDVEFWLWSGEGSMKDGDAVGGYLSDLWHWSLGTGKWTQHHPVGPKPPARKWGNFWSTENGDLAWIHSGSGPTPGNHSNHSHHHHGYMSSFSDMWVYNVSADAWTLIYSHNNTGVSYNGTMANPGARDISFTATTGKQLWMIGGSGEVTSANGSVIGGGGFQDVWRFLTDHLRWELVAGPTSPGLPTQYGTQGVPAATNLPPPIHAGFTFPSTYEGQLWMMGGENGSEVQGMKNDLWSFDIEGKKHSNASHMWTWQKGNKPFGCPAHYGTRGVPNSNNTPGARYAGLGFSTKKGLYTFGGFGIDANGTGGYLGDTWNLVC